VSDTTNNAWDDYVRIQNGLVESHRFCRENGFTYPARSDAAVRHFANLYNGQLVRRGNHDGDVSFPFLGSRINVEVKIVEAGSPDLDRSSKSVLAMGVPLGDLYIAPFDWAKRLPRPTSKQLKAFGMRLSARRVVTS